MSEAGCPDILQTTAEDTTALWGPELVELTPPIADPFVSGLRRDTELPDDPPGLASQGPVCCVFPLSVEYPPQLHLRKDPCEEGGTVGPFPLESGLWREKSVKDVLWTSGLRQPFDLLRGIAP